jgi:putative glycosyltransferase (TIGR04348 family)
MAVILRRMRKPPIVIVTPALADANNGNWQTARRWATMLGSAHPVRLAAAWAEGDDALMIALHARRSAPAIQAWKRVHPHRPLAVVLTGTDLYRDIAVSDDAQRSLVLADRLITLQSLGPDSLPAEHRSKARVVLQSAPGRRTLPKTTRHLRAVMVGHLREEKSPITYLDAARRLAGRADIRLDHIGTALDPALGELARSMALAVPTYRWLGGLPHVEARRRIQAAHVLVHPSRMEGGAHVVIEAITSGTPVLASRIDGNVGLLGNDYEGCFPVGDAAALAALLERCRDEPAMLVRLQEQCARRAALFHPDHERAALLALADELLETPR